MPILAVMEVHRSMQAYAICSFLKHAVMVTSCALGICSDPCITRWGLRKQRFEGEGSWGKDKAFYTVCKEAGLDY